MASDVDRAERTGIIGRIDPFCWLPVVPLLVLTVFSLIIGIPVLAVLFGVSALALLAFDSWVNRPRKDDAPVSSAGRKRAAADAPRRRPARQPAEPRGEARDQRAPQRRGRPTSSANSRSRTAGAPRRPVQSARRPGGQREARR